MGVGVYILVPDPSTPSLAKRVQSRQCAPAHRDVSERSQIGPAAKAQLSGILVHSWSVFA